MTTDPPPSTHPPLLPRCHTQVSTGLLVTYTTYQTRPILSYIPVYSHHVSSIYTKYMIITFSVQTNTHGREQRGIDNGQWTLK